MTVFTPDLSDKKSYFPLSDISNIYLCTLFGDYMYKGNSEQLSLNSV